MAHILAGNSRYQLSVEPALFFLTVASMKFLLETKREKLYSNDVG